MQICHCGAQAGYRHSALCPFPLFNDSPSLVAEWWRRSAELEAQLMDAGAIAATTDELEAPAPVDPEYADVDEDGQLSLGVAGEQREIPGLARARTTHEEN